MKLKVGKSSIHFFILLLGLTSLDVSSQNIDEQLGTFSEIKVFNGLNVVIIPAGSNKIEITGHSKDKVSYEIIGGRLEIRTQLDNIWSEDNTQVTLYGSTIEIIDANEGPSLEVKGVLKQSNLVLRAQEGASIFAEIHTERAKSKVISGGRVTVQGSAKYQDVEVNTGGNFFGKDLVTEETEISVSTAGRGEVHASQYCKATASLGGIIIVTGNPETFDHKTSLGGKIL